MRLGKKENTILIAKGMATLLYVHNYWNIRKYLSDTVIITRKNVKL